MQYRFLVQGGFVELHLSGVLDELEPFTSEEWEIIGALKKVLYNYDEVEEIRYDPWAMAEASRRMADRGIRFAGYAEQSAWFGVNRQLVQIAIVGDSGVQAFQYRSAAIEWLLGGGEDGASRPHALRDPNRGTR